MHNPYSNTGPNLENSSTRLILITPDDVNPLPQVCKSLRIWNPNTVEKTFRVVTTGGDDEILTVPAKTLWTEPLVVQQVKSTNTEPSLIIHGYTD